ncbi:hypothetical protein C942_00268 [Photobacterium marinum]|uniref:Uncharacterized protein n=1 Tax=Photobacterium marinum TaxID=1056511 RepID=L8JGL5_9GAMM|nr:hypothetical protein C942_00268 [Photobacterium marinum]
MINPNRYHIQAANSAEIHNLSNQLIEKAKQLDEVEQL